MIDLWPIAAVIVIGLGALWLIRCVLEDEKKLGEEKKSREIAEKHLKSARKANETETRVDRLSAADKRKRLHDHWKH